jgi:hypothetical protein
VCYNFIATKKRSLFIVPIARGSAVKFFAAECKNASLKYASNVKLIMLARNIL